MAVALEHFQCGRWQEAEQGLRQILKDDPKNPLVLKKLAETLITRDKWDDAIPLFEQAHRLDPKDFEASVKLAAALRRRNRLDEAIACYRQSLELRPDFTQLYLNLGEALRARGSWEEAMAVYQEALKRWPFLAQAHYGLAKVFEAQRKLADTVASYQRAIQFWPYFVEAYLELGNVFGSCGKFDQAVLAFRQALQCKPDCVEALTSLGGVFLHMSQLDQATTHFQHALRIRPDHAEAHNGLGMACNIQGKSEEAEECFRKACRSAPRYSPPRYNLGLVLLAQGDFLEAGKLLHEAIRLNPQDHVAHSAYVSSLNCDPQVDGDFLLAQHRGWAERHFRPEMAFTNYDNVPDPRRPLKVGYLSPDFRLHAVSYFLEPILAHHNRQHVESFCYADVAVPDTMTRHLQGLAHQWRNTVSLPHEALVNLIRQDRIDILIDLNGHMGNNRLAVFARKPAPIQVGYLGYPATTGLPTIDYRLVDAITDPPNEPTYSSEELVRLPLTLPSPPGGEGRVRGCFCCYLGPPHLQVESSLPANKNGAVTFGSLHKLEKLNDAVLDLWCQILKDVPGARLLLAREILKGKIADKLLLRFRQRGIDASRIVIRQADPFSLQHMRLYGEIDVALDSFPWSGHTTACESLWMGVPVVTLRGQRFAGRMVASVLTCLGLTDQIAETPEEYRRLAVQLANDLPRLAELRARLRPMMIQSPLCDGTAFTRGLEEAYRWMWHHWCEKKGSKTPGPQPTSPSRPGSIWESWGASS
jgi:predicted O-linked N-acetylglucosamine transferase (SPINDLY family)